MKLIIFLRYLIIVAVLWGVGGHAADPSFFGNFTNEQFRKYWYSGRAEISRFDLEQARYGEIHKGDAVLIFVTETLNHDTQVKADTPRQDDIPVLKLNFTRKFYTGIYMETRIDTC